MLVCVAALVGFVGGGTDVTLRGRGRWLVASLPAAEEG